MLHECRAKRYLLAISEVNSMVHSFLDWTIRRDTIISNNSNFEIRSFPKLCHIVSFVSGFEKYLF